MEKCLDPVLEKTRNYYRLKQKSKVPLMLLFAASMNRLEIREMRMHERRSGRDAVSVQLLSLEDAVSLEKTGRYQLPFVRDWEKRGAANTVAELDLSGDKGLSEIAEGLVPREERAGYGRIRRKTEEKETSLMLYLLALELEKTDPSVLRENYAELYGFMVKESGENTVSADYRLAVLEKSMMGEEVKSLYSPYAAYSLIGAMLPHDAKFYADIDGRSRMQSVRLLMRGLPCRRTLHGKCFDEHMPFHAPYDAVVLNYLGQYDGSCRHFHDCVIRIFGQDCPAILNPDGCFIGTIRTSDFETLVRTKREFHDLLFRQELLEAVILLPRDMLVVKLRRRPEHGEVCLASIQWNDTSVPFEELMRTKGERKTFSELMSPEFSWLTCFSADIPEKEGFEIMPLSEVLEELERKAQSGMSGKCIPHNAAFPADVMAAELKEKHATGTLPDYSTAFVVRNRSLIMRWTEDRQADFALYSDSARALYSGFCAFEVDCDCPMYVLNELRKDYVKRQIRSIQLPWSKEAASPEWIDRFLNVRIYMPLYDSMDDCFRLEMSRRHLPDGFVLEERCARYTVTRLLGQGGFGNVYKAKRYDWRTCRETVVALKELFISGDCIRSTEYMVVPNPQRIESFGRIIDKFRNESEVMQDLSRYPESHIVNIIDSFYSERTRTFYYVMDYLPQGSLEQELERRHDDPVSEEEALSRFIIPVGRALQLLHEERRMLHLDVKPANIMIGEDGIGLLSDFGVAKEYDEDEEAKTRGTLFFTQEFAPPELGAPWGEHGLQFRPDIDVYSLAATLCYILGKEGDTGTRILEGRANCSPRIRPVVERALNCIPDLRPATMEEFLKELEDNGNN